MSVIKAFTQAAADEFYRGLRGTDQGIMRAIGNRRREELTEVDYKLVTELVTEMLANEWIALDGGRQADAFLEAQARYYAEKYTLEELVAMIPTETTRPEMVDGHRSTSAATHNEAVRHMWEHSRHIHRAISIKQGGDAS